MTTSTPLQFTPAVPSGVTTLPGVGIIAPAGGKPARAATLVGPGLIALAKHYTPPNGAQITFQTGYGSVTTVIESIAKTYGDLLLMYLRETVDDTIKPAQFATIAEITNGTRFVAVGLEIRPDFSAVPIASPVPAPRTVYATGKNAKFVQDGIAKLEPGDSGAPIFVQVGTRYKLVGTNYSITPREFFSNLGALYVNEIPQL